MAMLRGIRAQQMMRLSELRVDQRQLINRGRDTETRHVCVEKLLVEWVGSYLRLELAEVVTGNCYFTT